LYSIAILLAETGALERCHLLGIDCRPEAIERARAGWFSEHDMSGVSKNLRNRYFDYEGDRWRAKKELRERMHWKVENVLNLDAGFQNDIILFRNLVLYLTASHAECAWSRLYGQLKLEGVLVCGKADKPPASLPLMRIASCIYQKPVWSAYVV
jgi:chemotaxis methyl-accepting protein methylase